MWRKKNINEQIIVLFIFMFKRMEKENEKRKFEEK